MNKQELIDKAVEHLSGNFDNAKEYNISLGGERLFYNCRYDKFLRVSEHVDVISDSEVISRPEFTQRARELGWINGYKYGVEYETNGKKPDLPDDCEYQVKFHGMPKFDSVFRTNKTWSTIWESVQSFKIAGHRYKPVEVEMSKSEPEMSKECLNKFPPVGSICVYTISGRCTSHVEITGHGKYGVLARIMPDSREETYHNWNAEKHRFNKIKSDREKFVDAVLDASSYFTVSLAEILYDAGCRFK